MNEQCARFFYGNCPIIKQENQDLIKEFLADLDRESDHELIEKWEARVHG